MRLFIGLALTGEARDLLWNRVSGMNVRGQLTEKANYHLTLAFLGMRQEAQVAGLKETVTKTAAQFAPLQLLIQGTDYFGRRENALLHATLAPRQPLQTLADTLRRLLTEAGETFDSKPFVPHITLARKADLTHTDLAKPIQPISFAADRLTLYHATRVEGALTYIPIVEAAFSANSGKAG